MGKTTWLQNDHFTRVKEAMTRHMEEVGKKVRKLRSASQEALIQTLNPIIRGWANYYRTVVAVKTFSLCDHLTHQQLRRWAYRRHPTKGRQWIVRKYWKMEKGASWIFQDQEGHVRRQAHCQADSTPHQSQRNGKSIRRQCSLLEYKTQKTPSAEWNAEQAASETTREMSLV